MDEREDQSYRAAVMHYVQGQTMEVIGRTLGVSRSTVSRLLKSARDSGMVRVSIAAPDEEQDGLAAELHATFGVRTVVVPVRDSATETDRLDLVAKVAAARLGEWFGSDIALGVAWGTTVAAVARHLVPSPTHGSSVVQLNGSASPAETGLGHALDAISAIADAFDARMYHFPVPAFFDYAETRQLMWQERSIRRIRQLQTRLDLVLFGVGALAGSVPSHVYSAGYLSDGDLLDLQRAGVVGDVCTVFLREDGSYRDIEINARATGPTPGDLRRIERRVCVAAGSSKVPAILGALRAGVATDLIVDETTARGVLRRAHAHPVEASPARA